MAPKHSLGVLSRFKGGKAVRCLVERICVCSISFMQAVGHELRAYESRAHMKYESLNLNQG